MTVTELKQPETQSDADVMDVLRRAMDKARGNRINFVAIQLVSDDHMYTDWCLTPKGTFSEAVGVIEFHKQRLIDTWKTK